MPRVDRLCVTHHDACDCREAARREREQQLRTRVATLEAALRAWEKWEGDIIADPDCWPSDDCLPRITQALWDRVVDELQPIRNAALTASPSPIAAVVRAAVALEQQCGRWESARLCGECRNEDICKAVAALPDRGVWGS